jgi:hypothetical protein
MDHCLRRPHLRGRGTSVKMLVQMRAKERRGSRLRTPVIIRKPDPHAVENNAVVPGGVRRWVSAAGVVDQAAPAASYANHSFPFGER